MASNIVIPDVGRTKLYSAITGVYTPVGAAFTHSLRMFRLINNTDGDMYFSVTDGNSSQFNFFLPANSFVLYDVAANSGMDSNARLANGTQFYVMYATEPTTGSVYVEALYGKGE
jgi:hypothetical protein